MNELSQIGTELHLDEIAIALKESTDCALILFDLLASALDMWCQRAFGAYSRGQDECKGPR